MRAVVIYIKFAPFHHERLEAAGMAGSRVGHELVGVEVAASQADYVWPELAAPPKHYRKVTLFPNRDYWAVSRGEQKGALVRALEEARPDVVLLPGWGFACARSALAWCLRNGVAMGLFSDSQPIDNVQIALKQWSKRLFVSQCGSGFAGGRPHVRYLDSLGLPSHRCVVGCDVVDNEFFARESAQGTRPATEGATPVLVSCLRLLPRKNILGVLRSLQEVEGWTWMIAGDGPQRKEIEASVRERGLQGRVSLLGHVDYGNLPGVYAKGDVYVQPSLSEPWGLAVNEAMACGLPVVVSRRCGCHEDLVRDGVNGYTFDPGRPRALTDILVRLLREREQWRAMGAASTQIIANWGLDLYGHNLWKACELALNGGRRSLVARTAGRAMGLVF